MDQLPLPSSLDEVETLILALYQPNPPETVSRIQDVLQRVQRSPQGWQISHGLLEKSNDNVKFFGALTIIVKLNTASSALSEDDAKQLLQSLIGWFVRSLADGSGPVVIRKLCSALVTFFIHFSQYWPNCVQHLVYCLDIGRAVPVDDANDATPTAEIIRSLEESKLLAALWFAASFVEDVGKTEMNSQKYMGAHERLLKNSQDITTMLAGGLMLESPNSLRVKAEAVKCFQAWILYAQRVSSTTDELVTPLRNLVIPTMKCLLVEDLYDSTVELFTDVLSNYSGFFTEEHYDAMFSLFETEWSQERYTRLVQGDFDFDSVQYGMFMIAFGDAKVQDLMEGQDPKSKNILSGLCGLLSATGYPVGEDKIFVPALEFWSTFVETMTDCMYSEEEGMQNWMPQAMVQVMQAVSNCYGKIQMVDSITWKDWDSTERVGWNDARKDVADFLQAVYPLRGPSLVTTFVDLLLQSISSRHWGQIEAALFCLGAISDCVGDEGTCDTDLHKIFSSSLFQLLGEGSSIIPHRLQQSALSLIERYSDFFERHHKYLPDALNLLFGSIGDPLLEGPSSKSIMTLCSSCRSQLVEQVEIFLSQYQHQHNIGGLHSLPEERILTGIASIIQAISQEERKVQTFEHLLSIIQNDAQRCLQLKTNPQAFHSDDQWLQARLAIDVVTVSKPPSSPDEAALLVAERVLRSLASIARGMQGLAEGPVDLDSDEAATTQSSNEHLTRIQNTIMNIMVQLQDAFSQSGEVNETICNIFRAGFSETEPGPFVFAPNTVIEFFTRQTWQNPRIGTMVSTVCSFISSLNNTSKAQVRDSLYRLLPWIVSLLKALPEPETDSELAQNGIEFVHRSVTKNPEVLLGLQPTEDLEFFFLFALKVLNGKEPLPKGAAADFWSTFIALKSLDSSVQAAINNAMEYLGPLIAQSLMQNIGGNASRSELDKLSDPLKKLVVNQVHSQRWLEAALSDDSFPGKQVSREEKSMFLKKIINLRGNRQTNQVVREFWLACRGSNFAYAS